MSRIFDQSNPIMRALSKLFDIGWLSILYLIFCIPVITIGPATTALYYTAIKVLRRERGYVWQEFWGCFKSNFLNGLILGIIFEVLYVVLYFNINYVGTENVKFGGYLYGAYIAMAVIGLCLMCYVFPVLSRFVLKKTKILRLSLYMAFRHFLFTIVHVAIVLASIVVIYIGVVYGFPIVLLVVPGLAAFAYTFPMEVIMKKYMPKEEPVYDEDGLEIKPWYME